MSSVPWVAFISTPGIAWPEHIRLRPFDRGRRSFWQRQWSAYEAIVERIIVSLIERSAIDTAAPSVLEVDWADIQSTLSGSNDAYARIVSRYQQTIGAQMWRFTKSQSTYEDLVHDVFVEAYLSMRRFRGEAPLIHWLRKIAVRVGYRHWKDEARRRNRSSSLLVERESSHPSDETEKSEASAQLHWALGQLSPRDRLVVTLVHLEQHSLAEAADLLGWSTTMVKVQAFRARGKLRKLLQEPS